MSDKADPVSQALATENVTEQKLVQLEKDYTELALKPITNDEEFEVAMNAKRDLRTTRTTAVKICKAGREEAIAIQKTWLDKEKAIVARVEKIEAPLDEQMDAYKAIAEARHKEEEAEKKLPFRKKIIENAGIKAEDSAFKYLSDDEFQVFFDAECVKIADEKKAAEAKKKADEELEAAKKKAADDAIANAQIDIRKTKMIAMGFNYSQATNTFIFEIINILVLKASGETVFNTDIATFQGLCDGWQTQIFEGRKVESANNLKTMQDKAIADANAEMNRKTAEAKRLADEKEAKRVADERAAAAKAEADRVAEIKRKALAPDKEKLQEFVNAIKPDYPIVATEQGQAIVARAKRLFTITIDDLQKMINQI